MGRFTRNANKRLLAKLPAPPKINVPQRMPLMIPDAGALADAVLTQIDERLIRAQAEAEWRASTGAFALAVAALHDEFGFGQQRQHRWLKRVGVLADAVRNGECTMADVFEAVRKENGIDLKGADKKAPFILGGKTVAGIVAAELCMESTRDANGDAAASCPAGTLDEITATLAMMDADFRSRKGIAK